MSEFKTGLMYDGFMGTLNNLIKSEEKKLSKNYLRMSCQNNKNLIINNVSYEDEIIDEIIDEIFDYYNTDFLNNNNTFTPSLKSSSENKNEKTYSLNRHHSSIFNNFYKKNSLYSNDTILSRNSVESETGSEFKIHDVCLKSKFVIFEEYTKIYSNIIKKKGFSLFRNWNKNIFLKNKNSYDIYKKIQQDQDLNQLTIMYGFKSWTTYNGIIGFYKNNMFYKNNNTNDFVIDKIPSYKTLNNKDYKKFIKNLQLKTIGKICYIEKFKLNNELENNDSYTNDLNLYNILYKISKQFESKLKN